MSSLNEMLATISGDNVRADILRQTPKGLHPHVTVEGDTGEAVTPALETGTALDDTQLLEASGLNPDEWEIVPPVRTSNWDAQVKGQGVKRLTSHKFNVARKVSEGRKRIDDTALMDALKSSTLEPIPFASKGDTVVIGHGDWQIGKMDGDGPEGTITRIQESIQKSLAYVKKHRPKHVHIAILGDCIEGFVSQGGKNAWRTPLGLNEQIRIVRRLLAYQIKLVAPYVDSMTVGVVGGNHDQEMREPVVTKFGTDHLTEIAVTLSDMFAEIPAYSHVEIRTTEPDSNILTMTVPGATILHYHGHQHRTGKHWEWWHGQAFDRNTSSAYEADIALSGHTHALKIEMRGDRTYVVVPAQEQESTWWKLRTGMTGYPGALIFRVANGVGYDYSII